MKLIITGGCGFIGSAVVEEALRRGHQLRVIDDLSKPESSVKHGYEFVQQDLTLPGPTREIFEGYDACINLAAKIGGIGYFHQYPATILSENNKLYSAIFEAALAAGMRRIVYVSSSMVFESAVSFPSKESDLLQVPMPISAYGFSKLIGEWYCRAFREQFGLPFTICRPFNAYGVNEAPGEEVGYAHVIPDLIKKCLDGQDPLEILGDGKQTRSFTHVNDIARGILVALESKAAVDEDFNVSSPEETQIDDLAAMIWRLTGRDGEPRVAYAPGFKHDVRRRIPEVRKAREILGFEAATPLDRGLAEVIAWIGDRGTVGTGGKP